MPVKVVAFVTVKPGADDAFLAAASTCAAASRTEAGTLYTMTFGASRTASVASSLTNCTSMMQR